MQAAADGGDDADTTPVPERVGRLASLQGWVSWHDAEAAHWDRAALNFPVAEGDAFWTQPDSRARLEIGPSEVAMNGGTELDIDQLDPAGLGAAEPQGEVVIHVAVLAHNERWTVQTPRGLITLKSAGCYGIVAGDTEHTTEITVIDGAAAISGTTADLQVEKDQTAVISGNEDFVGRIEAIRASAFLKEAASTLCQAPPQGPTQPLAVLEMTGGTDLAAYGTWSDTQQYGAVWYPRVETEWTPYKQGYWGYFGAWGWTWIDREPWGFAPFHYGRWVRLDGRWAWVPGAYGATWHPVYAPALVSFFDTGHEGGPTGGRNGLVAWVPLGPREPYYPWFHASPAYVRAANGAFVPDVAAVVERYRQPAAAAVQIGAFANRAALTAIPAPAMASSAWVSAVARPIPADRMDSLRPVVRSRPILPAAGAVGLTAGAAARLHVVAGAGAFAPFRAAAPGPEFRPGPVRGVNRVFLRPPPAIGPGGRASGLPGVRGFLGGRQGPAYFAPPGWHGGPGGGRPLLPGGERGPAPALPRSWHPEGPFHAPAAPRYWQPGLYGPGRWGGYPHPMGPHLAAPIHSGRFPMMP